MKRRSASLALLMLLAFGVAWWWRLDRMRQMAEEFVLVSAESVESASVPEPDGVVPIVENVPAESVEASVPIRKYPYLVLETEAQILQLESDYLNLLIRIGTDEVPYTDTIRHDIAAAFFEDVIAIIPDHDQAVSYFREGMPSARIGEMAPFDFQVDLPADPDAAGLKLENLAQSFLYLSTEYRVDRADEPRSPILEAKWIQVGEELVPAVQTLLSDYRLVKLLADSEQDSEPYHAILEQPAKNQVPLFNRFFRQIHAGFQWERWGGRRLLNPQGEFVQIISGEEVPDLQSEMAAIMEESPEFWSGPLEGVYEALLKVWSD